MPHFTSKSQSSRGVPEHNGRHGVRHAPQPGSDCAPQADRARPLAALRTSSPGDHQGASRRGRCRGTMGGALFSDAQRGFTLDGRRDSSGGMAAAGHEQCGNHVALQSQAAQPIGAKAVLCGSSRSRYVFHPGAADCGVKQNTGGVSRLA
jgi:hypothetical protein